MRLILGELTQTQTLCEIKKRHAKVFGQQA
jgi:hypothetical protein